MSTTSPNYISNSESKSDKFVSLYVLNTSQESNEIKTISHSSCLLCYAATNVSFPKTQTKLKATN